MKNRTAQRDGSALKRLEFEMALELGLPGDALPESARRAAAATGGEFLFALPGPDGRPRAVVRFLAGGESFLLEVREGKNGRLAVAPEDAIDGALRGFARTSIDVMERLRADARIVEPPAAGAT